MTRGATASRFDLVILSLTAFFRGCSAAAASEHLAMKICDICRKTVTNLQSGPPELDQIEVCGECFHDLLRRFSIVEQRLAETKRQWRAEAITEWKRERGPKGGAV